MAFTYHDQAGLFTLAVLRVKIKSTESREQVVLANLSSKPDQILIL